jgi:hypothetical protein
LESGERPEGKQHQTANRVEIGPFKKGKIGPFVSAGRPFLVELKEHKLIDAM